jgi:hypothetical protein
MRTRGGLIPNPICEIRKTKTRPWQVHKKKSTEFYCNDETKTE